MSEQRDRISTTSDTGNICCPFFVAHGKTVVICEGLIDGTRMCCEFKEPKSKTWHQENYCEKNYKRCEMYCSIQHWKWPDDE